MLLSPENSVAAVVCISPVEFLYFLVLQLCQVLTGPKPCILCVCAHGVKGIKTRMNIYPLGSKFLEEYTPTE
jgi:hypothetical protein